MYTLCLSGGGFRATIFHLGVIRRLIYLGIFKDIKRINSVSGGSIAAGFIVKEYTLNGNFKSVEDFDKRVITPLIDFIQKSPKKSNYRLIPFQRKISGFQRTLDKYLFDNICFSNLSHEIYWACYATSLNSMLTWKFSQKAIGDSRIGYTIPSIKDKVSLGVASSACFPPLFRPVKYQTKGRSFIYNYKEGKKLDVKNDTPPKQVYLLDGGVYDNLGTESVLQGKSKFIISDASAVTEVWGHRKPNRVKKLKRVIDVTMDQNTKLRRRLIFDNLLRRKNCILVESAKKLSTYISKEIEMRESPTPVSKMPKYILPEYNIEDVIGNIRTDLNAFHDVEIHLLLWNGMAKIDAALKRWAPTLIMEELWDDTPILRMDQLQLDKSIEILRKGSSMKVFGESHYDLHVGEELIKNITQKL